MKKKNKQIIIGTANFGLNYGQGNLCTKLDDKEIVQILNYAQLNGIDILDTAINYGNCSKILGDKGIKKWKVITKLPKLPNKTKNPYDWCNKQILTSIKEMNVCNLDGVLLHYPEDVAKTKNNEILKSLFDLKKEGIIGKIGISIYEKKEIDELLDFFKPEIIQCPLNIIDTRLLDNNYLENISKTGIEIHIRSIFLQGILLNSLENLPYKFLKFSDFWLSWKDWLESKKLNPLEACIRFVNSIPFIEKIIVGINSKNQLKEVIKYFEKPSISDKPKFNLFPNENLLDPRTWDNQK